MTGGLDPTQFVIDIRSRKPEDAKKRLLAYVDMFRIFAADQSGRRTSGCDL